nr:hypothetical protein [Tanacetum cinerariifolium]
QAGKSTTSPDEEEKNTNPGEAVDLPAKGTPLL